MTTRAPTAPSTREPAEGAAPVAPGFDLHAAPESWRRAAWGHDFEARAARHEGGHLVILLELDGGLGNVTSASITPSETERAEGVGGFVRRGEPADPDAPPAPLERDEPDPDALAEPTPELLAALTPFAARYASGVAAEYPSSSGGWLPMDARRSGRGDLKLYAGHVGAVFGVRIESWHGEALELARKIVDQRWGQVLAIAAALLERGELDRAAIEKALASAPTIQNTRPSWEVNTK